MLPVACLALLELQPHFYPKIKTILCTFISPIIILLYKINLLSQDSRVAHPFLCLVIVFFSKIHLNSTILIISLQTLQPSLLC